MGLKQKLQERIERDAVRSTLSYTDSSGNEITEDVLLKRSKIPLVGDWGRIYPPLNEDGSWNIANALFGGKKNLIKLISIMLILALLFWWVSGILGANKEYMNGNKYVIVERTAFDKFCQSAIREGGNIVTYNNISILNFTFDNTE